MTGAEFPVFLILLTDFSLSLSLSKGKTKRERLVRRQEQDRGPSHPRHNGKNRILAPNETKLS